jgi:hypothetical protein
MTTLIIGPDVGNEELQAAFAGAAYPLEVAVKNLMPRTFRHNALDIELRTCMGGIATETTVNIGEFAQLQKLFTEAAAIGRLNSYPEVLELRATIPVTKDLLPDDSDAASDGLNTGIGEELPPVGDNAAVSDDGGQVGADSGSADGEALAEGGGEELPPVGDVAVSGGGTDDEALATGGGEPPATADKAKNRRGGK